MMNNRQKCLLYFLGSVGECSRMKITKVFVLLEKETAVARFFPFYGFVPYKFGPYSFELYQDIDSLAAKDQLKPKGENNLEFQGNKLPALPFPVMRILDGMVKKYKKTSDKELLNQVYTDYPQYTIFSEIEKKQTYERDLTGVLTVGYEGASVDRFLMNLINEKVQVLVDVRQNPWSMKWGFKEFNLVSFCNKLGIEYIGYPQLGISGTSRKDLQTLEDYLRLFEIYKEYLDSKGTEINELVELSKKKRIALLCFEKDPQYCHRTVLAQEMERRGAEVKYT